MNRDFLSHFMLRSFTPLIMQKCRVGKYKWNSTCISSLFSAEIFFSDFWIQSSRISYYHRRSSVFLSPPLAQYDFSPCSYRYTCTYNFLSFLFCYCYPFFSFYCTLTCSFIVLVNYLLNGIFASSVIKI